MKTSLKVTLITVGIVLLIFLYIFGFLSFLNTPMNNLLYGPVDISCNIDSDCVLKPIGCTVSCACHTPVNKDWNRICPFGYKHLFAYCGTCPSPSDFEIKCINNKCEQVFQQFRE